MTKIEDRLAEFEARARENWPTSEDVATLAAALRAVAGIHYDEDGYCPGCGLDAYEEECKYGDCPTRRAIAAALAVTP